MADGRVATPYLAAGACNSRAECRVVLECGSRFWAVDGGALYTINEAGVAYCSQPVLYGSPDVTAIEASAFTEFGASFVYVRTGIPSNPIPSRR
jgi:hypothetical protein